MALLGIPLRVIFLLAEDPKSESVQKEIEPVAQIKSIFIHLNLKSYREKFD